MLAVIIIHQLGGAWNGALMVGIKTATTMRSGNTYSHIHSLFLNQFRSLLLSNAGVV